MNKEGKNQELHKKSEKTKPEVNRQILTDVIDLPIPSAPICTAVNFNSIFLEWDHDDTSNDRLYILEYMHGKKKWETVYNGYAKSENIKSLKPDTAYCFRLKYKKAGLAESEWSDILEVTTESEPESMLDLHDAVQHEDLEKVVSILKKDKDHQLEIDSPDHFGFSALMKALQMNCNKIAEELINHGANINYHDASGRNCLMAACFVNNLEGVKLLRKLGCEWTAKDIFGNTPLHCAIEGNSLNVVKWALSNGADVNVPDENGWTPLLKHASVGGLTEITKVLLAEGASINAQDIYGNTALILATVRDHPYIAQELLSNNCDPSIETDYHRTAMTIAEGLDRRIIIKMLNKFMENLERETITKDVKDVKKKKIEIHTTNDDTKEEAFLPDNTQIYKIPREKSSFKNISDTSDSESKLQKSSKEADEMEAFDFASLLNPKLQTRK